MVIKSKPKSKKKSRKSRTKALNLKRETVKDVTGSDQKKVKGGGGLAGGVCAASYVSEMKES